MKILVQTFYNNIHGFPSGITPVAVCDNQDIADRYVSDNPLENGYFYYRIDIPSF